MKLFNIFKRKTKEKPVINEVVLYVISYDLILTKKIEEIFNRFNIKYDKIEIDKDMELNKKLTSEGIDIFPCIVADGQIIKGINVKMINKVFGLNIKNKMNFKERFIGESQLK